MNKKNKISDYDTLCRNNNVTLLNVDTNNHFQFYGSILIEQKIMHNAPLFQHSTHEYLTKTAAEVACVEYEYIWRYFEHSGFAHPLILEIIPCNDDFHPVAAEISVEFDENQQPKILDSLVKAREHAVQRGKNYLQIKVRDCELKRVCLYGLPWEDLSIGFQCRIFRQPDIYNSEFWYYFTNIYIGETVKNNFNSA